MPTDHTIKYPVAKNPRKNPWIEHVNKKAKELGISYPCAINDKRVRDSYPGNKIKKLLKPQKEGAAVIKEGKREVEGPRRSKRLAEKSKK